MSTTTNPVSDRHPSNASPFIRFSIDITSVPPDLREHPQWVAWRHAKRSGKDSKVPYCAATGQKAASNDPVTWGPFEEAVAFATDGGHFDGLGFVLTPDDSFAVIDLDHCIDEEGTVAPWAQEIISSLQSYTEVSPSGDGVHIWVRGTLPPGGRKRANVELYDQGRYMTVTGQHLDGSPLTIENRQPELDTLQKTVFATATGGAGESETTAEPDEPEVPDPDPEPVSDADDDELIQKASAATKGDAFRALWAGRWRDRYKSQSEADLALCRHLAFWAAKDPVRIDRLFRRSGLCSKKWEEREDYRSSTISKAIKSTRDVYTPPPADGVPGAFSVSDAGVFYVPADRAKSRIFVCSRFDILAMSRDDIGEDWSRLISVRDADDVEHKRLIAMRLLADAGVECRRILLSLGVLIGPTRMSHELLSRYLQETTPPLRVRSVTRSGWYSNMFILPDNTVIGAPQDGTQVFFQPAHGEAEHHFAVMGTLAEWQRNVARPCIGNTRLVFPVSCPFGAIMLRPLGEEGGGFHLCGPSSLGKTTAQILAGSVCGTAAGTLQPYAGET